MCVCVFVFISVCVCMVHIPRNGDVVRAHNMNKPIAVGNCVSKTGKKWTAYKQHIIDPLEMYYVKKNNKKQQPSEKKILSKW